VFLEDATWNALCDIARERDCIVDDLCLNIDNEFPNADFTSAARLLRPAPTRRDNPPIQMKLGVALPAIDAVVEWGSAM
jgi:predicted DNA-binding ribbon-helix-helix protein